MKNTLLKITHLKKDYILNNKVKHALNNVSFDIYEGEVLSLLGVNGAGKTTLSSIVATLHPPTSGSILWENKSVFENLIEYRSIVGFCPQEPNLNPTWTLEENLIFSGSYYGLTKEQIIHRKNTLLEKFNLSEYAKSFAFALSGGYRQRFLIARTLMHDPKLIILDEPTVGLDPQVRRQLWQVILDLKKEGKTIILTTHYIEEAEELSDRVCIIDSGKVISIDTPSNLKTQHEKGKLEDVFLKLANQK